MNQTSSSERRLSAALDRLDRALDAVARRPAAVPPDDSGGAVLATTEAARDAAHAEATRLAAENERLIAANRALAETPADPDARLEALQAELAALRALRAAETAQMEEILSALENLTSAED